MSKTVKQSIALQAHNIHLNYGKQTILDNIDLTLYCGQVTALLGPNGAGKSTLLKCLSGEITVKDTISGSKHTISYFGKDKQMWSAQALARHLAMLPQHSTLSFPFLVNEVVALGTLPLCRGDNSDSKSPTFKQTLAHRQTLNQKQIEEISQHYMVQADVAHLSERLYPSLSGGEKQRVHLARVLTQLHLSGDDKILMLDEPTSALDLAHQHNTLLLARNLAKQQNAAVIIVLHDLNLAAQYADRLILLSQGKIVKDDSPWQALTPELLKQVYQYEAIIDAHPNLGFPVVYPKN